VLFHHGVALAALNTEVQLDISDLRLISNSAEIENCHDCSSLPNYCSASLTLHTFHGQALAIVTQDAPSIRYMHAAD
jgi:hypothetical protein